jgi:hypothetical protein
MGVHHVSVGVTLPGIAILVLATEGAGFFWSKRLLNAACVSVSGLVLVYLYLPLSAMRSPLINWGNPRNLEQIWWHVTGRQYQVFLAPSMAVMTRQLQTFFTLLGREFGVIWAPLALVAALIGMVALFRRDRAIFWCITAIVLFDMAWALNYEIAEDKDAYYLPTFAVLTIAAGYGVGSIGRMLPNRGRSATAVAATVSFALLVPGVALGSNLPYNNRHNYLIARDYIDNIEKTIEPGGMLLTADWQVYSPFLYLREIEGQRKDIVAIDLNQLRRTWYYQYLDRSYPETMAGSRDKVDAFLQDLRHWDLDPEAYQSDLALNQEINSRFYDMLEAVVTNQLRLAPVYITLDIATNTRGQDSELTAWLLRSYDFVPSGLVFQVVEKGKYHEPPQPQLETRGLNDGKFRFADDDVVKLKVLPVYTAMMFNRGRYLAVYGHTDAAIDAYNEALALDPNYKPAEQAVSEARKSKRASP